MLVIEPEGVSTCRSKNAKGEWVDKVFDHVMACSSQKEIISDMMVTEDFESRPQKAVTFVVKREKTGMERARIEEGANWIQRRKTTKKKHGRERQGRRRRRRRKRTKTREKEEEGCFRERKRTEGQHPYRD